jgi:hypothetical protein
VDTFPLPVRHLDTFEVLRQKVAIGQPLLYLSSYSALLIITHLGNRLALSQRADDLNVWLLISRVKL